MNVYILRDISREAVDALRHEFHSCAFRVSMDLRDLQSATEWPEVVFGNPPAELVARMPRVHWLQIVSAGFDEYSALGNADIIVSTAGGVHAPIIAQHVLMNVLLFTRAHLYFAARQREHTWDRRPAAARNLAGQTIALVGCGNVARAVARVARPFGARVAATQRSTTLAAPEFDALLPWSDLDALLFDADHVVVTLPLTTQTRGVLDRHRLAAIKAGAVLHNISRGALVDEPALVEHLESGHLGGAALDVFADEPLSAESPLWDIPNVVITPHIAGHHRDLGVAVLERFKSNLRRFIAGAPLEHVADFARGY